LKLAYTNLKVGALFLVVEWRWNLPLVEEKCWTKIFCLLLPRHARKQ